MDTFMIAIVVLSILVVGLTFVVFALSSKKKYAEDRAREAAAKADDILKSARKEAENTLKEAALQAKDYQLQVKLDFERETRERKNEISQLEKRLLQKEDVLDRKTEGLEARVQEFGKKEKELTEMEQRLERRDAELQEMIRGAKENLERAAGVTAEQAKDELVEMVTDEAKLEAGKKIRAIDEEFKEEAGQ
ncbi:MAG: DUF3552 domain-containing protein, partial [Deltaproteobacteria bacterium]|nr:DUF3552 domain-containing protein [Deltaproteobacteria bacterium]